MHALLLGVLTAPLGAVVGVLVTYGILCLRMPENQGRRGLLAGVIGIPAGLVAGFITGHTLSHWLSSGQGPWKPVLLGLAVAIPAALIAAAGGLIVGIHVAESRGVTNYAGERGAWGLLYVALPAAVLFGIGGFLLGRYLGR